MTNNQPDDKGKNKVKSILESITSSKKFIFVFPVISNFIAYTKINAAIKSFSKGDGKFDYVKDYNSIPFEKLHEYYVDTFEVKKTFEDKAKTTVLAVTIAVTVITSLMSLIFNMNNSNYIYAQYVKVLLIIFSVLTFIFLLLASILSFGIIGGLNRVYKLFPDDYLLPEEEKRKTAAECIELNNKMNRIRNNYLSASYRCIVHSLITLCLLFLITSTIAIPNGKTDLAEIQKNQEQIIADVNKLTTNYSTQDKKIQDIMNITESLDKINESLKTLKENQSQLSTTKESN